MEEDVYFWGREFRPMTIPLRLPPREGKGSTHINGVCGYIKVQCSAYHAPFPDLSACISCAASIHQYLNPYKNERNSEKKKLIHFQILPNFLWSGWRAHEAWLLWKASCKEALSIWMAQLQSQCLVYSTGKACRLCPWQGGCCLLFSFSIQSYNKQLQKEAFPYLEQNPKQIDHRVNILS